MLSYLPQIIIAAYLLIINLVGYLTMYSDKQRAKNREWRVPEKRFFIIALIGGSIGVLAGMYGFRHKTLHKSFTLGIPAILILQLVLVIRFVIF